MVLLGLGYPAFRTYLNSGNAVVATSRRAPGGEVAGD